MNTTHRPSNPTGPSQLLIGLTLFAGLGACSTVSGPPPFTGASSIFAKPEYAHARWGIHVEDLATGEILISRSADDLFAPASNTKLFSVAAALEEFGAEHRFETFLYRRGEVDDSGALAGDLIRGPRGPLTLGGRAEVIDRIAYTDSDHIYSRMNPRTILTKADPLAGLQLLADEVAAAGIRRIHDVIIDDRYFPAVASSGSGPRMVTPILVNDNLIDFLITPQGAGQLAKVEWRPESPRYTVESRVRTSADGPFRISIASSATGRFLLTGAIAAGHPPQIESFEVLSPAENARWLLIDALDRAGVDVLRAEETENAVSLLPEVVERLPVIARLRSAPFSEEARLVLKVSHNLHASALPMLIAARRGDPDPYAGMRMQADILRRLGVSVDAISFGGAAGGDRADMVTPRVIVELLRAATTRPWADVFHGALPILGVDGTLHHICTGSPARGKVFAKTGTYYVYNALLDRSLLTVKALSGYIDAESGRRLAFSILLNNVHLGGGVTADTVGEDLGQLSAALQQMY